MERRTGHQGPTPRGHPSSACPDAQPGNAVSETLRARLTDLLKTLRPARNAQYRPGASRYRAHCCIARAVGNGTDAAFRADHQLGWPRLSAGWREGIVKDPGHRPFQSEELHHCSVARRRQAANMTLSARLAFGVEGLTRPRHPQRPSLRFGVRCNRLASRAPPRTLPPSWTGLRGRVHFAGAGPDLLRH